MKFFSLLIFLAGCTLPPSESDRFVKLSPTKQKQKIALLQKKIKRAEKEQKSLDETVDLLREEVDLAELIFVRRMGLEIEEKFQKLEVKKLSEQEIAHLFLDEREALIRMIQSDPTPSSFEAQAVLDQILRFLTTLSDKRK